MAISILFEFLFGNGSAVDRIKRKQMCGWVLEQIYNENEVIRKQLEIVSEGGDLWKI